jgi:hypothetical protein
MLIFLIFLTHSNVIAADRQVSGVSDSMLGDP